MSETAFTRGTKPYNQTIPGPLHKTVYNTGLRLWLLNESDPSEYNASRKLTEDGTSWKDPLHMNNWYSKRFTLLSHASDILNDLKNMVQSKSQPDNSTLTEIWSVEEQNQKLSQLKVNWLEAIELLTKDTVTKDDKQTIDPLLTKVLENVEFIKRQLAIGAVSYEQSKGESFTVEQMETFLAETEMPKRTAYAKADDEDTQKKNLDAATTEYGYTLTEDRGSLIFKPYEIPFQQGGTAEGH